jgi:hypothetical protein
MSRDSSLVPTNLLDWPKVAPLLPELKLILIALWASRYLSCAGVGAVPIRPFASTLGLSTDALSSGLKILSELKLIELDELTDEVFIVDWYRFHTFKTTKSFQMLLQSARKIESNILRAMVESNLPASYHTAPHQSKPTQKDEIDEQTGVIIRTDEDRDQLANMVKKHGAEKIKSCVEMATINFDRPFVSKIVFLIKADKDKKNDKREGLNTDFNPDDEDNKKGIFELT